MRPIVFLHIPKTAGQTIHNELTRVLGAQNVSPIRLYSQDKDCQFPPGYALYSGHLDWHDMGNVPKDRFTFSVLRDPRERIASFYFYTKRQAEKLEPDELAKPSRTGMRTLLQSSADEYFFGGAKPLQRFINDQYNNFYCSYFATKRMRAHRLVADLPPAELVELALQGAAQIDRIYATTALADLEADMAREFGMTINLTGSFDNAAGAQGDLRWPKLLALFEDETSAQKLEGFVTQDLELMRRLDQPSKSQ